jgi:hypothetical protein
MKRAPAETSAKLDLQEVSGKCRGAHRLWVGGCFMPNRASPTRNSHPERWSCPTSSIGQNCPLACWTSWSAPRHVDCLSNIARLASDGLVRYHVEKSCWSIRVRGKLQRGSRLQSNWAWMTSLLIKKVSYATTWPLVHGNEERGSRSFLVYWIGLNVWSSAGIFC